MPHEYQINVHALAYATRLIMESKILAGHLLWPWFSNQRFLPPTELRGEVCFVGRWATRKDLDDYVLMYLRMKVLNK